MKTFRNILILTGLIFISASCSKFLDEKGYNTDYTFYQTVDGINALTVACYQNLRFDAQGETAIAYQDMGTDIYMLGADGGWRNGFGQFQSGYMNPSSTGNNGQVLHSLWANNYKGIYACNLGMKYISQNTDMIDSVKRMRKGEMAFLRAYYYYVLVTQFGDIPLTLEATSAVKTDYVRVPQNQIWSQIMSDAVLAYNSVPWADANGKVNGDYGRIGKGAVGHFLAKAYYFRYCDKYAKSQSDAHMIEDRGGKTTDLDSCIWYASRVCNFGTGAGSGSNHKLASDYSTLWGFDPKTGSTTEYMGPEVVFSINNSTTYFLNNVAATEVNTNGNWLHLFYTMYAENYPLSTLNANASVDGALATSTASWGSNVGVQRDLITGRPWRRLVPTPYYYADNGLYAAKNYATGKLGKLIDSRIYKSHVWVYYCNNPTKVDVKWSTFSNPAGSFNPASIGKTAGSQRYANGDTAILLSLEDVTQRFPGAGTATEKLALARAQEKYWYLPMQSMPIPKQFSETGLRDVITNGFPTLIKHLDGRRAAVPDQGGYRNIMKYRLAETYILLSEAYARKADFTNAANALNMVRDRAAWAAGEKRPMQHWKYDGGSKADDATSTKADMEVTPAFLSSFTDTQLTDFYMDEMGHETAGELNRFELLVRYGADYWYNRVTTYDYFTTPASGGSAQKFHRFRPIPQYHIDNTHPADPNAQNYGYY